MSLGTNVLDKRDIRMGIGKLYINNENVGQLKGDVVLTPQQDFKEFLAGVPQQVVKTEKFKESATLKASYAELNYKNVARAMGTTNIDTTFTAVTAESHVLTGTTAITVDKNRYIKDVVVKQGTDTALLNTDYTFDLATGKIARKTGSTVIEDGDTVTIDYKYLSKAVIKFGGSASIPEMPVKFVYESPDGDERITTEFYLGQIKGGQPITFKEEDYTTNDIEITATTDSSREAGDQLGNITYEFYPEA